MQDQTCPTCGRVWPPFATRCTCGTVLGTSVSYLQPIQTPQPPVQPQGPIINVQVVQPSNVPSYPCPRCNSPYTNPITNIVSNTSWAWVFLLGIWIWPILGFLPFLAYTVKSQQLSCHNCGLTFQISHKRAVPTLLILGCVIASSCLLCVQIWITKKQS